MMNDPPSPDVFALRRSGLNDFLFAIVGAEANGMTLSVVSVFARLGNDPWQEASRLALLPRLEATESLDGALQACRRASGCDDNCRRLDLLAANARTAV